MTFEEVNSLVASGLQGIKVKTDALTANMTPNDAAEQSETVRKSLHKRLYFLTGEGSVRREEHERFALITGMRRDGSSVSENEEDTLPIMKLGAVLKSASDYWVCLTPVCDCVRLPDDGGEFMLANLKAGASNWSFIAEADGKMVKLLFDRKRQTVKTVMFGPAVKSLVRAAFENKKIVFREVVSKDETANRYEWLGEMKPMQAQRIVQNFANNIARVGLDEFEWQRRWAPPV